MADFLGVGMEQEQEKNKSPRISGTKAIYLLYIAFFAVWCAGLAMGEAWSGKSQPVLLELPAWFLVGCVFSFIGVSIALILCVRRYF